MTKKTKIALLALAVAVPVTAGAAAVGYAHGHGHGRMAEKVIRWHVDEELAALDATEAQRQQVHEIEDRLLKEIGAAHRNGGSLHAQLLTAFEGDAPDKEKVHQLVDSHVDDMRKVAHDVADGALDLYRILTPEQRQKLVAHVRDHMGPGHEEHEE